MKYQTIMDVLVKVFFILFKTCSQMGLKFYNIFFFFTNPILFILLFIFMIIATKLNHQVRLW